jgi:gliding motility-associated-like protein
MGIKGMTKYPDATINIFDRYGKQITTLTISNQTWDGTINGKPLPTSDYWYVITIKIVLRFGSFLFEKVIIATYN